MLSKIHVSQNVSANPKHIESAFNSLKNLLVSAFPMELPSDNPIHHLLTGTETIAEIKEYYDPDTAALWWANKELVRQEKLCKFIGINEKTKIIAKLQRADYGAPVRDSPVSSDQQKEMMAYYYRKQKEIEALEKDDDDGYLNSAWADSKGVKNALNGLANVSWKSGFGR